MDIRMIRRFVIAGVFALVAAIGFAGLYSARSGWHPPHVGGP
jgi:hypothetical protein